VSGDPVRTQQLFKKTHELNFTLLADIKGDTARKFGVPLGKGGSITQAIGGKDEVLVRGVTAKRWTFVIGKDGRIAYKNTSVNVAEDSKAVLEVVKKLKGS
jgi:peroxiredoxin Q/BCP